MTDVVATPTISDDARSSRPSDSLKKVRRRRRLQSLTNFHLWKPLRKSCSVGRSTYASDVIGVWQINRVISRDLSESNTTENENHRESSIASHPSQNRENSFYSCLICGWHNESNRNGQEMRDVIEKKERKIRCVDFLWYIRTRLSVTEPTSNHVARWFFWTGRDCNQRRTYLRVR